MKIRCGSHQQNRSIVRPGLSLMATKVALTAEEFRENSQRSIALFNTEKLSTDSTHVLKSAYCNSVHFCRCNLHGACGGKEKAHTLPLSVRGVAICTERVEAKFSVSTILPLRPRCNLHGACGGKAVSTRRIPQLGCCCNLHGACGGKGRGASSAPWSAFRCNLHGACGGKASSLGGNSESHVGCNLHGACGGKGRTDSTAARGLCCNLHGACGGKG